MIITRNDIPEHSEISSVYKDPWHLHFSSDHSYIYSFPNGSFPSRFHVQLEGLDSGNSLVLGFCTPLNIQPDKVTVKGTPKPEQVNTFAELLEDRSGTAFFWDQEVGIMFRRFQVDLPRSPEDRTRCVGDHCPEFFIDVEDEGLGD